MNVSPTRVALDDITVSHQNLHIQCIAKIKAISCICANDAIINLDIFKRHMSRYKFARLGHDLPLTVNDRVI